MSGPFTGCDVMPSASTNFRGWFSFEPFLSCKVLCQIISSHYCCDILPTCLHFEGNLKFSVPPDYFTDKFDVDVTNDGVIRAAEWFLNDFRNLAIWEKKHNLHKGSVIIRGDIIEAKEQVRFKSIVSDDLQNTYIRTT